MNFQFGVYAEIELLVDLTYSGVTVALADGHDAEAQLWMGEGKKRRVYEPFRVDDRVRQYNIVPLIPDVKEGGVYLWTWIAHYYWTPPNSNVTIRRSDITLARTGRMRYRLEVKTWQNEAIQYLLDKYTSQIMEESYRATNVRG